MKPSPSNLSISDVTGTNVSSNSSVVHSEAESISSSLILTLTNLNTKACCHPKKESDFEVLDTNNNDDVIIDLSSDNEHNDEKGEVACDEYRTLESSGLGDDEDYSSRFWKSTVGGKFLLIFFS